MKKFYSNWACLTKDNFILSTIKGYKVNFIETPHQAYLPPSFSSKDKAACEALDKVLRDMVFIGAIKKRKENMFPLIF